MKGLKGDREKDIGGIKRHCVGRGGRKKANGAESRIIRKLCDKNGQKR